ncbi:MAG: hypothetical protein L3J66_02210 [Bacteroidales bacterium]|nr:hypothetical protein [Bacteroidales bacterium]
MKYLLLICTILFSVFASSQDLIILRNGDEIKAKVTEINDNDIRYKRESNPTGPTYKLAKSKIFFIRYASGDKDFFGAPDDAPAQKQATSPAKPATKPEAFVYDPTIGDVGCQIKKKFGTRLYGRQAGQVYYGYNLVYYGFDFTYLILSNGSKMGHSSELIQKYFYTWNKELSDEMLSFQNLKRWMKKPSMVLGNPVFSNYTKRDPHQFVSPQNYCISFIDLQKIIKSYVLREQQGVGMVINLVNFNKEREYALVYVTFFDIATREILFAVEASGKAGGGGMTKHWATGVESAVREMFIDEVYKHRWMNNGMVPGKLLFY